MELWHLSLKLLEDKTVEICKAVDLVAIIRLMSIWGALTREQADWDQSIIRQQVVLLVVFRQDNKHKKNVNHRLNLARQGCQTILNWVFLAKVHMVRYINVFIMLQDRLLLWKHIFSRMWVMESTTARCVNYQFWDNFSTVHNLCVY